VGLLDKPILVFDVESIGLHGTGFAVGCVVLRGGDVDEEFGWYCGTDYAAGSADDREWVHREVSCVGLTPLDSPYFVRKYFWEAWRAIADDGGYLLADCCWPVEANFLSACVADDAHRKWSGPYPLLDLAPLILASGGDPIATQERLENELPAHNPLNDARQSARLLITVNEWLRRITPATVR
jgi:hypothetical protein